LESYLRKNNIDDFVSEKLNKDVIFESNLTSHINECISRYPNDKRSLKQAQVAQQLAKNSGYIKVLAGAAGCGKTKIALEWAGLRNAQQIIWVCPRVQICLGMFKELKASEDSYLKNARVEIVTGEFKFTDDSKQPTPLERQFSSDVIITTIDQLLSSVVSHTKADRLLNYLSAHIVFDEYHEYINMPAFNLLFPELLKSREALNNGANVLLVSATPHYYYLEKMLGIDVDSDVVEMPSFNTKKYKFDFVNYDESIEDVSNPLYKTHDLKTFVISNTATTAQKSYIQNFNNENSILLHSKFKKSDKKFLFDKVFNTFKKDGSCEYDILRSGPIVQASLNVSCEYMVSEITTAENCLQRMGRLDRFGVSDKVNRYAIVVPLTLAAGKFSGALARFLCSSNSVCSTKAWYEFLLDKTNSGEKINTVTEIYEYYKSFYKTDAAINSIKQDMLAALKKSAGVIVAKVSEPQIIINKKEKDSRKKISANSLRGDSCFVQLVVCENLKWLKS